MPDARTIDLLPGVEGIYRDNGLDAVPPNHVWDCVDLLPRVLGAPLRKRGGWITIDQYDSVPESLIYASFLEGEALLAITGDQRLFHAPIAPGSSTLVSSAVNRTRQYPVPYGNRLIIPDYSGIALANTLTYDGSAFTLASLPATSHKGRHAAVWRDRVVLAGGAGQEDYVYFGQAGDPMADWDALTFFITSGPVKGLAAQRAQLLVFHESSVERLRGSIFPAVDLRDDVDPNVVVELLFDMAGCYDPRSIVNWNDQVLFADSRGIHITDGMIVRNVAADAGIVTEWRRLFEQQVTAVSAITYGVYYLISLFGQTESATFLLDIPRRKFVRLKLDGYSFAVNTKGSDPFTVGAKNAERLYGGHVSGRVTDLTPIFQPDTASTSDGDGAPVLPLLQTGWSRLGRGYGWRRIVGALCSYSTGQTETGGQPLRLAALTEPLPNWGSAYVLGTFSRSAKLAWRFLRWGARAQGVALELRQTEATDDTRIYGLAADSLDEAETRT